jgi:hypothetical protein
VVNLRNPPLETRGLKFEMQPSEPAPFYFAGTSQPFSLVVTNPTDSRVKVTADVIWQLRSAYGAEANTESVTMDVPPNQSASYGLRRQWLSSAGEVVYTISLPPAPNRPAGTSWAQETHPLASYTVFDRGVKDEQDKHQSIEETLQRRTLYAFIASIVASVVIAGTSIYLSVYH